MNIKSSSIVAAACGVLFGVPGCTPEADTPMTLATPAQTDLSGRIQITRIGVFNDALAYDDKRGIYIIKDIVTGKEYVGISGIGISELGSHKSGKSTVSDER